MRANRLPFIARCVGLLLAAVFGSLAYLAIAERHILVTTRTGSSQADGAAAVVHGFIYLGAAVVSLAALAAGSRFRNLIWLGCGVAWLACVGVYAALAP
jgi:hypothetical protein